MPYIRASICDNCQYCSCRAVVEMCVARSCLIFFPLALLIVNGHGARILGLFPHVGKSHYMVFQPLLQKLAERGHQVTTVSFFPMRNPPANYTDVSLEGASHLGLESMDLSNFEYRSPLMSVPLLNTLLQSLHEVTVLRDVGLRVCESILNWPSLADALTREYDLVLMENFNSDCMLGLMHVYGMRAPIVGISSCTLLPWTADRFGLVDNPAYVPLITTSYTTNMTFKQRLENSFVNLYLKYWYHQLQEEERGMIERHFGVKVPDLEELGKEQTVAIL
ncbi:unnamed protein product, partial [Iphiclides podalirius]